MKFYIIGSLYQQLCLYAQNKTVISMEDLVLMTEGTRRERPDSVPSFGASGTQIRFT